MLEAKFAEHPLVSLGISRKSKYLLTSSLSLPQGSDPAPQL